MLEDEVCAHGEHRAPEAGGSCPCGMVTRVPARPRGEVNGSVLDLVARCLAEPGGVPDLSDLRRRAGRVLGALTAAGLVIGPGVASGSAIGRRPA
ncbi:hypothetical protein [Blastococcus sp. CCUG 61487]|uniref:hypothetical protein n=1 Tax=Blastococcus sp. CCUG 61487 TaxID=1840703 RepID=UPI0010BFAE26|nr:hypothetical protein [Blastococcus sp. CCUG 61487]TKJ21506.1 hypothetical protein A6V29_07405 [Blastococcus sp. CCUG 61487]